MLVVGIIQQWDLTPYIYYDNGGTMVKIVTDSAADFEPEEYEKLDVICVPLKVLFGNREYSENRDISKSRFYELLENSKSFPKTSQPSPAEFREVLAQSKNNGDEAVVITLSSALSGSYQSASAIKNWLDYKECYVIDSRTASAGQRIMVEYAVSLRNRGKTAKEIAEILTALRSRITLYACIDTLAYLHKGGRISGAAYAAAAIGNVKPVLRITQEGKPEILKKTLGIKRGIDFIINRFKLERPDMHFPIYVMYTHNRKSGEQFAVELSKYGYKISPHYIVDVGAVIGSHIGINACGLVYVADKFPLQ